MNRMHIKRMYNIDAHRLTLIEYLLLCEEIERAGTINTTDEWPQ